MSNGDLDEIYKLLELGNNKRLFDIINERMNEMGLSKLQLSKILSIDKSTFDRLIKKIEDGEVNSIDFYQILKICQFFQISVEEISQLYVASLSPENIAELELARKANFIIRTFDLRKLKDEGFIKSQNDIKEIESRIVSFFCLNSVFEYTDEVGAVLFSKTKIGLSKKSSHDKMKEFWVRSAYYQFQKINNPNEYERERLLLLLPKLRAFTRLEEKGLVTVVKALYNIGITVIVQSYLANTKVRGGTFLVNGKPCIVITDFNKHYCNIWFALLHELYHVLNDIEELASWKYHLTGEPDLNLFNEDLADYFACEMLFPKEKLNFIRHQISVPALVFDYAEQNSVHPSIIYNFYCYDESLKGNKVYQFYQKYFGNPEKAIQSLKTNPWDKKTIYDEIERIKEVLTSN